MTIQGYYRYPTIHADRIVFVSEDDLWSVPAGGGAAQRLTANLGAISFPHFSPDGETLAFTGREEGPSEVYTMPGQGGPVKRISYLGVTSNVIGWSGARVANAAISPKTPAEAPRTSPEKSEGKMMPSATCTSPPTVPLNR